MIDFILADQRARNSVPEARAAGKSRKLSFSKLIAPYKPLK